MATAVYRAAPARRPIHMVTIVCEHCGAAACVATRDASHTRRTCSEPCRLALWRAGRGPQARSAANRAVRAWVSHA